MRDMAFFWNCDAFLDMGYCFSCKNSLFLLQPGCKTLFLNLQCYEEGIQTPQSRHEQALTPKAYQKLSRLPFFLPLMRKVIPLGFKY